jgi:HAD superfamily hydrolase (TIGR01484 family)
MSRRLFAIDLDGTLLRADGTIDPRDFAAIRRAIDAGVVVTLATGRLVTGTLPTARALGLEHPIVCADGGILVSPRTGERLEQRPIPLHVAQRASRTLSARALAPFVLMYDAVHCDERGREHAEYVGVWTREVTVHPRLDEADAWRREGEVAFMVGIGARDCVEEALAAVDAEHGDVLESVRFRMNRSVTEWWVLLARPRGCSKGAALARLCQRLGIARERTAAVGDHFNDVPMFEFVARSFAMGQAVPAVRAAASDGLRATIATGGGVAEALDQWLADAEA